MGTTELSRKELQEVWRVLFRITPPVEESWDRWETFNTSADVREAILQLASKHKQSNGQMSSDHMVKFVSSVLGRINKQRRDAVERMKTAMSEVAAPVTVAVADDGEEDDARWNRCYPPLRE